LWPNFNSGVSVNLPRKMGEIFRTVLSGYPLSVDVLIGIFLSQSVANLQFSLIFTFAWRR
jgi:hypothetical protein